MTQLKKIADYVQESRKPMSNNTEEQGLRLNCQLPSMLPFTIYSKCILKEVTFCVL